MTSVTSDAIVLAEQYGAHNYHPLPLVITRGEGVWVYDQDGRRYLDGLSAYSALNHGHRHPKIIKALADQMEQVTLTSRAFHNAQLGPFLKMLCEVADQDVALPMNTGAEAVETAIKAVRKWGYTVKGVPADAAEIIVCSGNFHGRTTAIVGFSSEEQYRHGFGPFAPGFKLVPYGDFDALEQAFNANTVGFMAEPIQGEAGIIIPPEGYLQHARELCDTHGALLVLDEIQTGFGRTGKMFCSEHEGVKPDVLVVGKALGGGVYPVSAALSSKEVMSVFSPGDHGSTFGGNPLGAAVGRAALSVLIEERLPERSATLGAHMLTTLRQIGSPHIAEVRGRGLFVGVEIKASSGPARPFCEALMAEGILAKETHHQVIRFAPPLTIERETLDWALERITDVLTR